MRALVLNDWWDLAVAQRPTPSVSSGDVLIEVIATGICGSDLHGYTGENGRREHGQVMGHETVGQILTLGSAEGDGLGVGDIVTVNPVIGCGQCARCAAGWPQACETRTIIGVSPERPAAFAELLAAPTANVVKLPMQMPAEYGALVEPLAVGYHAVLRAPVTEGDAVLVIGGGPIGQACVLGAFREGASAVVVSEPNAARRTLVEGIGAQCIDPSGDDGDDLAAAVTAILGSPPAVVVDAVGSDHSLRASLTCAPAGAPIVLVGMAEPRLTLAAYEVSTRERHLIGSFCYTPAEFQKTAAWVSTAPAELAGLIEGRVDLAGGPDAFHRLATGEWEASKVLIYPNGLPA